jgi:antitoxin ParD1/3/4
MGGYTLSPQAEHDIFEIWSYIAGKVNVAFANQVESERFDDFQLLARSPRIGYKRQDLTASPVLFYRAFPYQYMIIYRLENSQIGIVAVLHAKRNIKKILRQRS